MLANAFGALLLVSLGACGTPVDSAEDEAGPWMYDAATAPPGAVFESTELKDPEYDGFEDNPVHHFEAGDSDSATVLAWYRESLADDGWRLEGSDDHQLIASRAGPDRQHVLIVETHTPEGETFRAYTVEEYQVER